MSTGDHYAEIIRASNSGHLSADRRLRLSGISHMDEPGTVPDLACRLL